MRATAVLKEKGVSVQHMHVSTLKPFTDPTIVEAIKKSKYGVVTIENHLDIGGLGSAVADVVTEECPIPVIRVGVNDVFGHSGPAVELLKEFGLTADNIIANVKKAMALKK